MRQWTIWVFVLAIIAATWGNPVMSAGTRPDLNPMVSVSGGQFTLPQIEATPVDVEPETSDPANSKDAPDSGSTSAAATDFPNVCDGTEAAQYEVQFSVRFPEGDTTSSLQVRVFAENGGCIPGWGYAGPVMNFPDKATGYGSQTVDLPAGRYVYEYSGDGFESQSRVPFQVVDGGPDEAITITPVPIPSAETVTLNVTIPAGGSSMNIVISDQIGVVESFVATATGTTVFTTKLPARGPDYDYYYEFWGDDYPWSDRIAFSVVTGADNTINITPVIAAIILTPSQAPAGTIVEVRVTGFRAGDEYELNFNNGQIVEYGSADPDGNISATITIPNLPDGKYPVVVTGAVSGQRVEATYTVRELPQTTLNLDPVSGPSGRVVAVSGSGYAPGETVYIRFDGDTGQVLGYKPASSEGTFTGMITIPSSASMGDHTIVSSQDSGQRATATFTVTERPVSVMVTPTSVKPGTIVTVTGSGFQANEIVDIRWGSATGPLLGYRTADSSGSFTGRVTVPKTASAGDHTIFAIGRTSNATGSATLSVTAPQVTVSPTSQTSGKVVSVAGSGFTPGKRVDIRWNSPSGKLIGYLTANDSGSVSGKVTVPAGTVPGDYSVVMIDLASGLSGSSPIKVTGATVTVTPQQASPGTVVSVIGSGFGPSEVVDIRWNGPSGKLLGYRTTSSEGSMSGKVTIPADAQPGTYTLFLQGRTSGIVGSVTVVIPAASSFSEAGMTWRPTYSGATSMIAAKRPAVA